MKLARLWAALAAGLVIGTITAFAQPAPRPGLAIPMLVEIEGALNLSATQKVQFDAAAAATRQAMEAARARHEQWKAAIDAEIARARPHHAALATRQDGEMEAGRASHIAARSEWLKLYAMLDDSQAAVVKAFLEERMLRIDDVREKGGARSKGMWG